MNDKDLRREIADMRALKRPFIPMKLDAIEELLNRPANQQICEALFGYIHSSDVGDDAKIAEARALGLANEYEEWVDRWRDRRRG